GDAGGGPGEAEVAGRCSRHARAGGGSGRRRGVPAERQGGPGDRRIALPELAHDLARHEVVLPPPAGAEPGRERVDVRSTREEPGVTGDAAHRIRVIVVHLAAEHAPAPWAALGGCDHPGDRRELPCAHGGEVDEGRRAEPERLEDALMAEAIERGARHGLDQLAEQHEPEVAVDAPLGDLVLRPLAMDLLVHELLRAPARNEAEASPPLDALDVAEVRTPGGESGAVREEMPER